jgi:hypothetical protein
MLNDAALVVGANAIAAAYPWLSLHTAGAVSLSTSESSAARVAAGWSVDGDGDMTVTNKAFTGGTANGPVVRVGYWSASSGGTYGGGALLTGDQTFNSAGEYTVTSITENNSSS